MKRLVSLTWATVILVVVSPNVAALGLTGWIIIIEQEVPALPLRVGVDEGDGRGFGFVTYTDDNADGMIELPLIPVGSRLALGVNHTSSTADCDIWDLLGSDVVEGSKIKVPLLIVAEDIEGEALGIDFGELAAPPLTLTPGDRFTVVNGMLPGWPGIRLVNDSGVPDLETFVAVVDTLPDFNGDVIVSDTVVRFTFVPEPTTCTLALAALCLAIGRRPSR